MRGPICILVVFVDIPDLDVPPATIAAILPLMADGVVTGVSVFPSEQRDEEPIDMKSTKLQG